MSCRETDSPVDCEEVKWRTTEAASRIIRFSAIIPEIDTSQKLSAITDVLSRTSCSHTSSDTYQWIAVPLSSTVRT